jgi:hypothetical protein
MNFGEDTMGNVESVIDSGSDLSLEEQISILHEKHTQLEQALREENRRPMSDAETVKEIKHQKLAVKDETSKLGGQ